jgi:dienelactone hydrolase
VSVVRDITYVQPLQEEVEAQVLDIYHPLEQGSWPVVIFLHGFMAKKEGHEKESLAIAEAGAVVFTPNWPTWISDLAEKEDGKGYREMHEVIACAIRFARQNAKAYGGDPSHVTLVGFSMGAGFGAGYALAGDEIMHSWQDFAAERGGPPPQVGCVAGEGAEGIDAFVGIAGRYTTEGDLAESDPDLWNIVAPLAHVGEDPKPVVRLLHGERDTTVDAEASAQIRAILEDAGYDVRLTLYDGIHRVPVELTTEIVMELAKE